MRRDYTPASVNGSFRPSLLSVRISVGGSGVIFGPRFRVPSHPPGLARRLTLPYSSPSSP